MVKKFETHTENTVNVAINELTVGSSTSHNAAITLGKAVKKAERAYLYHHKKEQLQSKKLTMNSMKLAFHFRAL